MPELALRDVVLDGLRLHLVDRGRPGDPAVLLLHGFNQTARSWDEFAERIATEGCRAVAIDQRGHGDSDRAPAGDYSRESMADDPVRLADALGIERFALVGMSMGAVHAVLAAVRYPARVRALVIVDWAPDVEASGVGIIAQVARLSWPSFDEAVEAMHRFNPRRSLDNLRARLSHSLGQDEGGSWRWKVDAAGLAAHPRFTESSDSMWRAVEAISCPTLVVRGEQSDLLSAPAAERVASLARGRLVTVAGAGHSVPGDNPEGFHDAVAPFLREIR
jgi:esterase